jgi:hypothetical protein
MPEAKPPEADSEQDQNLFRAVAGLRTILPRDRPDLLLVELKTLQGPLRFAMTKGIAQRVAQEIIKSAAKLTPDRSAN